MKNKFCITYAGTPGSSKTPITTHLHKILGIRVHSNDAIRDAVVEELGLLDQSEYQKRRNAQIETILRSGESTIFDVSVDRE